MPRLVTALRDAGPADQDPRTIERYRRRVARTRSRWVRAPAEREPGEDREDDRPKPAARHDNINPWARRAGRAFDLAPSEVARLDNVQARAGACRRGKGIEIEHVPCGSRYLIKFGCRTRVCGDCGGKYQATKRQRFEPLSRLHAEAGEDSKLKFLTLTFPNVDWETPDQCRAWFRERTALLKKFLYSKTTPAAWGVKGYVAVWEVTAERECAECHQGRSKHDPHSKRGRLGNDCPGWREGEKTGRYHPHLHVLVWSKFIPLDETVKGCAGRERREYLRHAWSDLTGGRQIRIEPAEGAKAVRYILKYLGKPWAGVPDDLQVVALYRIRRLTSAGEFYGRKLRLLSARLMKAEEKRTWHLACPTCGIPEPEHPEDIETCSGDFERETVALEVAEDGTRTWSLKRITEWATVKLAAELRDLSELERAWLPAAWMAPIAWNGKVQGIDERGPLVCGVDGHVILDPELEEIEQVDLEPKKDPHPPPEPEEPDTCPF